MNVRKALYTVGHHLIGKPVGRAYAHTVGLDRSPISDDTTRQLLRTLFTHCQQSVPYYSSVMGEIGRSFNEDPESYLLHVPILTKELIRENID